MRNKHMHQVIADQIVESSYHDREQLIQDIFNALEIERHDAMEDCADIAWEEVRYSDAADKQTFSDIAWGRCAKKIAEAITKLKLEE
jgi:hypothetical protein